MTTADADIASPPADAGRFSGDDGDRWAAALRKALIAFVLSRIFVVAGAAIYAADKVVAINDAKGPRPPNAARLLMEAFTSWDGRWYLRIITDGYPSEVPMGITYDDPPARVAFFPLYPMLVSAVDRVLPQGPAVAGLFVNLVLGILAVWVVGLLARDLFGVQVAERSMILFAIFPGSFVLSFMYSEALLLLLAALCLLALQRQQWITAGIWAALATATRPNGLAVAAACAVAAFLVIRDRREWRALAAPLLAPIGVLAFHGFLWQRTGEANVWFRVQREAWNEGTSFGATALSGIWDFLTHPLSSPSDALTSASLVVMVVLVIAAWKERLPWPVVAYCAVVLFLMLIPATVTARPRFVYTAFPLFIAYAKWRDKDSPDSWAVVYSLCSAGLVTLTAMYALRGAIP